MGMYSGSDLQKLVQMLAFLGISISCFMDRRRRRGLHLLRSINYGSTRQSGNRSGAHKHRPRSGSTLPGCRYEEDYCDCSRADKWNLLRARRRRRSRSRI
jgi:hypothetical protein